MTFVPPFFVCVQILFGRYWHSCAQNSRTEQVVSYEYQNTFIDLHVVHSYVDFGFYLSKRTQFCSISRVNFYIKRLSSLKQEKIALTGFYLFQNCHFYVLSITSNLIFFLQTGLWSTLKNKDWYMHHFTFSLYWILHWDSKIIKAKTLQTIFKAYIYIEKLSLPKGLLLRIL